MNGELQHFACPVCGAARTVSVKVMRAIERGQRTGECRTGEGCRQRLSEPERLRRWWLVEVCGIAEPEVRKVGGAVAYVGRFGLPELRATAARDTVERVVYRTGPRREHARSKLPSWCFDQADGDPMLALVLAVELIGRGVPINQYVCNQPEIPVAA